MTDNGKTILTGVVVDEVNKITIDEVTQFCSVRREKIVALVTEGIVEPEGEAPEEWRFSGRELSRARKALRIESDLDINLSAVAVILDLLDRIDDLQAALGQRRR
jgi:chaperone modulatory protein CbpM